MNWLRKHYLALLFGSALSTMGCCYHGEQFGRTRDIGWGEVGCGTCSRSRNNSQGVPCSKGSPCGQLPDRHASSDQGLPQIATEDEPSPVIPTGYKESADASKVEFRRTERNVRELPVYVLPPDSVSNAVLVAPNPLPTIKTRIVP